LGVPPLAHRPWVPDSETKKIVISMRKLAVGLV
jgi:hypothetical protein